MVARRLLALVVLATSACAAATGCAVSPDEDVAEGDGSAAAEIVSERQLNGRELPAKTISLTFDDGPGRRTVELADFLADHGVTGTFFINGNKVSGRQSALDTVVARGHVLANHTQHHKSMTSLSGAALVKEVADTDAFIAEVQPEGPWLLRAPYGAWNGRVARTLNGSEMSKYVGSVFWDIGGELTSNSAADWDCWGKGVSVERCGELYLEEIRRRGHGVILMHDIHDKTVEMVEQILPVLLDEGFAFASLEEVPSVQRAIAAVSAPEAEGEDQCQSATLGRPVDEDVCVESRSDKIWYRCVDGDWASSSATDAKCTQRFPL